MIKLRVIGFVQIQPVLRNKLQTYVLNTLLITNNHNTRWNTIEKAIICSFLITTVMQNYLKYIALKQGKINMIAPELKVLFQRFQNINSQIQLCTEKQLAVTNKFSNLQDTWSKHPNQLCFYTEAMKNPKRKLEKHVH